MQKRNRQLTTYATVLCLLAGSIASLGCSEHPSSSKEFLHRRIQNAPEASKPFVPTAREELPIADSHLVMTPNVGASKSVDKQISEKPMIELADEASKPHAINRALNASQAMSFDARTCGSPEFPGQSPEKIQITDARWSGANQLFERSKKDLLRWLIENHSRFSQDSASLMEHRLHVLRLEKPQPASEPDLAWRGIGIATEDGNGGLIRLSPGFIEQIERQPERARFEMVRLVAQDWSPCTLARDTRDNAWEPFLGCMGMEKTSEGCGTGQYSEAAWAVSSAIASVVAKPGCTVPAFIDRRGQHCVARYVLPPAPDTIARGLASAKVDKESK